MNGVGDALVEILLDPPGAPRADRFAPLFTWLKRVSKPPLGVRLISDDGGQFTGIVVVNENRPVAMLAICVSGDPRIGKDARPYERRFDPGPLWGDDDDMYR